MITTYDGLKTAVENWMHRGDLTARIPEFIQMGEAVLNRKLRTVDMEQISSMTASTSSRFLALPSRYVEMQSLFITSPNTEIVYIEPSTFRDHISDSAGMPSAYTIKDQIEFNITPDQAYSVECRYLKKYDIASDSTNWLLTEYPELYLHSALAAAALYVVNDARLATFKGLTDSGIDELNTAETRRRGNGMAYMRCDESLNTSTHFNIYTGA